MVEREPSGAVIMNHDYIVSKKQPLIQELCFHKNEVAANHVFSISNIGSESYEKLIKKQSNARRIKSYHRTKNWIKENYPEWML